MYSSLAYTRSPVWIQEMLLFLYGGARKTLREDTSFREMLRAAEQRQYWPVEQLDEWRRKRLGDALQHAVCSVPYYRERFNNKHIKDTDPLEMLAQFPVLTKHDVKRSHASFIAEDIPRYKRFSHGSSGTTGTPLTLYHTLDAIRAENALIWRQMQWAGFREGERRIWLRGDMIVPAVRQQPPFWRMNRGENMLMMSSYHLSEQSAVAYLDAIRLFDPMLIQAYPSSIGYLANWLWGHGQTAGLRSLKGIITSSETLKDEQRERIEKTFGVRVFDWYGTAERVAAVGTCEHGRYHVIEDSGFIEFPRSDNGLTEIIGTGFTNDMMPLIRYSAGDYIELEAPDVRCACGRAFRLVKRLIGRDCDLIKTPDGRVMGSVDHIYKDLPGFVEAQIVQETIDLIEIRVVPTDGRPLPPAVRSQLKINLHERIGPGLDIRVVEVESLPRTKNGKLRPVVSKV